MENDSEILAQKRAWRKSNVDRRLKDGSKEDRQLTAQCIRSGRSTDKNIRDIEDKAVYHASMLAGCILLASLMILFFMGGKAHAYTTEDTVKAVIGEAEGESMEGKTAVACAINNRGTLKGVYGLHSARVRHHLYSNDTYQKALYAVEMAQDHDYCQSLINGAQYWEGTAFPIPYWAKKMKVTAVIGHQRFFRKD